MVVPVLASTSHATVKCVVWDLDNTLWNGTLLEDHKVIVRSGILDVIKVLDERGILHSIASRNDPETALAKLQEFGLAEYFIYPQIGWDSKSLYVSRIGSSLNIGLDAIVFVDDQAFEREEVSYALPEVRCFDASYALNLPQLPCMMPSRITDTSRNRRKMYVSEINRTIAQEEFIGTQEEFLRTLHMVLTISHASSNDLLRAEELIVRTHQLNTTGYTYSYEELDTFRRSECHDLLVVDLDDKYGSYGTIGLALLDMSPQTWTIKLLLVSCRVISRGIGTILINHIMRLAKEAEVRLQAEYVNTGRNRLMSIAYAFAGFKVVETSGEYSLLETDLTTVQAPPDYLTVINNRL